MKVITSLHVHSRSNACLAAAAVVLVLLPVSVSSQTASVRGYAKVDDKFVVRPVKVVAIAVQGGRAAGKPIPAYIKADGEYSIEGLSPGSYNLTATGRLIMDKVVPGVSVVAGNVKVQDLTLQMGPQAKVRTKVLNSQGQPITNAKVAIYSAELPRSVCDECMVAESVSNENGEVEVSELAGGKNYSITVSVLDEANKREVKVTAENVVAIGRDAQALVELHVTGGAQPTMIAKLLPDIQRAPNQQQKSAPELAKTSPDESSPGGIRTVGSGMKMTVKGTVMRRDGDMFMLRDQDGFITSVRLNDDTSVKTKGGFLRSGTNYERTSILRGLNLEVEGRGSDSGELVANKVRFNESDLRVARAVESRTGPLEERANESTAKLSEVEANAQRLSGQVEELAAVSNAARGGAREAQEAADAAVAGVNATNERISALDGYTPTTNASVIFRSGSAVLSNEGKRVLDDIARVALNAKGYLLEITGFADSRRSFARSRELSQRRADAVIRYLVEEHNIPLRRIVMPYGYGKVGAFADNTTREGRAENHRVEIKLLVSKGLTSVPAAAMPPKP